MNKTTKKNFLEFAAANGLIYLGSYRFNDLEAFAKQVANLHPENYANKEKDKCLIVGQHLKRQKGFEDDGSPRYSHLELKKTDTVYKIGEFWLVHSDYGNNVVYF